MSQNIIILLWIGAMAFIAQYEGLKRTENVCGEPEKRHPWWFAFLVFLPIIWMAGNRERVGDTGPYILSYLAMPSTWSEIPSYLAHVGKDKGFDVFSILIKQFIGNRYVIYLTIIAAIQGISVLSIFRKYSYNYICSIFLFVASTDYISWMLIGIRQFLAVTIIFAATPLMLKKKYWQLFLVILLASTIHQSALIMIPCVIIAQGKAWNKKTILCIFLAVLAVLFVSEFTDIMGTALEDTQYSNMISDYNSMSDDGTNPLRVLVYSVPAIIAFAYRKKFQNLSNPLINLCINMSIISVGIYLVSMVTSGIYIGRVPIYVSLYSYILLPWEFQQLFDIHSRRIAYAAMVFLYLIFYMYSLAPKV